LHAQIPETFSTGISKGEVTMDTTLGGARRRTPQRFVVTFLAFLAMGVIDACSVLRVGVTPVDQDADAAAVASAAGWTRTVSTQHYLFVVNVLPAEEMFTSAEHLAHHQTVGELILDGDGVPLGPNMRHVEAHIYDITTGLALTDRFPTIVLSNRTTGEVSNVPPTLMQDVNIGALDRHFGNNVYVTPNSDISVKVTVNGEEVSVDGHLD
jgi:hypothetical protein